MDYTSGCRYASCGALRVSGKRRQARDGQGDGVAVNVGGSHRNIERGAFVQGGVADVANLRRAVGVGHHDRQGQFADGGRAGAVTGIGGNDAHAVGTGLVVARRPHNLQCFSIKGRAGGQAQHLVADGGGSRLGAAGDAVGVQTHLGLEAWVVRIEGKHADAQGLAFQDVPGLGRIELRCPVGVEHMEHHIAGRAGADRVAAAGHGVGGRERDGNGEAALLGKAWGPADEAGFAVERGSAGQPGAGIFQHDAGAVGLHQTAGHGAAQLQGKRFAFAQRLRLNRRQRRLGIALRHRDVKALADGGFAVAGEYGDVVVLAGLVVAGRPGEQAIGRIKTGACGQVFNRQGDGVAIGVCSSERQ